MLAEEGGKYTRSSLVTGLNFLFFFLGILINSASVYADNTIEMGVFIFAFIIVMGLSFLNRSPIGGSLIGLSLSTSLLVGILSSSITYGEFQLSFEISATFGLLIILFSTTFSVLGFFFGLLGSMTEKLSIENPVIETFVFRDYWSNVFSLGKNNRREYQNLDQKLARAHVTTKDWWKQQIHRVKQTKPELIYVNQTKAKIKGKSDVREEKIGDVFDIASGQRIYDEIMDPSDLIGIYRPSILNIPAISNRIGGGRKLALEELISRFLGWFIKSKALWVSYLAMSAFFTYSLLNHFEKHFYWIFYSESLQVIITTSVILSIVTMYFVFRFHELSLELFDKRPDERIMIFSIYLILYLFYGFFYNLIVSMNETLLFIGTLYITPWIISILWLGLFTVILGLAYIFIHRESEVSNIYLYDDRSNTDSQSPITPYKDEKDKPFWLKSDGTDLYWVLRFMYFWRLELTAIPHPDWERIEVWADARTGDAKWIVSDYHYRELWYKVEGDLRNKGLHVGFLTNFHTPIPFVTEEEINKFTAVLSQSKKALLSMLIRGRIEIGETGKISYHDRHPPNWVERFGLRGLAASFCSDLNWCYWRYSWGIDNYSKYLTYPSTAFEEQPTQ